MTSVKQNDSLFLSSMGGNFNGEGVDDSVVNVTRVESIVSLIGVTRGESMVSSMSSGVATTVAQGDSMVSSIMDVDNNNGRGRDTVPFNGKDDAFVDDDDGRHH